MLTFMLFGESSSNVLAFDLNFDLKIKIDTISYLQNSPLKFLILGMS